jgi:hypothetical protein
MYTWSLSLSVIILVMVPIVQPAEKKSPSFSQNPLYNRWPVHSVHSFWARNERRVMVYYLRNGRIEYRMATLSVCLTYLLVVRS